MAVAVDGCYWPAAFSFSTLHLIFFLCLLFLTYYNYNVFFVIILFHLLSWSCSFSFVLPFFVHFISFFETQLVPLAFGTQKRNPTGEKSSQPAKPLKPSETPAIQRSPSRSNLSIAARMLLLDDWSIQKNIPQNHRKFIRWWWLKGGIAKSGFTRYVL